MIRCRALAAAILVSASSIPAAVAQAPPAPAPASADLTAIRTHAPTADEQKQITQWIDAQLQAALAQPRPDLRAFWQGFRQNFDQGVPAFRDVFAARTAEAFGAVIRDPKSASGSGPVVCAMMFTVLAHMKSPTAMPVALAALSHPAASVRERAASCVRALIANVPADQVATLRTALRDVGRAEGNPIILREVYNALGALPGPEESAGAILEILSARIDAYAHGNWFGAAGDARAAFILQRIMGANPNPLGAATQALVVRRLAGLLKIAVLTYVPLANLAADSATPPSRMHDLELLIDSAETALTASARAMQAQLKAPSVSAKMKSGDQGRLTEMRLELNAWIGTAQTPGQLNGAPFDLPVGLPGVEVVPTSRSTTQPATRPSA